MRASELVNRLQEAIKQYGDHAVVLLKYDSDINSSIDAEIEEIIFTHHFEFRLE